MKRHVSIFQDITGKSIDQVIKNTEDSPTELITQEIEKSTGKKVGITFYAGFRYKFYDTNIDKYLK